MRGVARSIGWIVQGLAFPLRTPECRRDRLRAHTYRAGCRLYDWGSR